MRKLLTALAATSLIVSLFLGAPAPVAAADTTVNAVTISSSDPQVIQVADALATTGRYQTYLVEDGEEITTRINFSGPDSDDGIYTTFSMTLAGSGATFGADFGDTNDMVDFGDCVLNWTDAGPNDQTPTFREGVIDCDPGSSQEAVHLDFPITVPTEGPAVLTVDSEAQDFKVYFFSDEPGADTIYVGPNNMTTDGSGSCADPDFSTNASQPQAFDDEDAIDSALMSINNNSDKVVLCNGTYSYSGDMRLYDGDDFTADRLTVEAQTNGSVTLDGNGAYQLIYAQDVNLDVTGVEFYDGETGGDGGAIELLRGNLVATDSDFDSNYASGDGGAAAVVDGTIDITDSLFTENYAGGDKGGAVYLRFEDLEGVDSYITDSNFSGNQSDYLGGAVAVQNNDDDDDDEVVWVYVDGTTFADNESSNQGGAIRTGHQVMLSVENSTFEENLAGGDGGAISAQDDATIGFGIFTSNETEEEGGAVYFDEHADISDSRFVRNLAADEGGAVFAETWAHVTDTLFLRNRATNWAGALSLAGNAWLDGARFRANHSRLGGAIDSWGERLYLTSTKFINNYASRWGGAIARQANSGSLTLEGDIDDTTIFRANRSRVGGPVALYRGDERIYARQAAHIWRATGASVLIVRLVKE